MRRMSGAQAALRQSFDPKRRSRRTSVVSLTIGPHTAAGKALAPGSEHGALRYIQYTGDPRRGIAREAMPEVEETRAQGLPTPGPSIEGLIGAFSALRDARWSADAYVLRTWQA